MRQNTKADRIIFNIRCVKFSTKNVVTIRTGALSVPRLSSSSLAELEIPEMQRKKCLKS